MEKWKKGTPSRRTSTSKGMEPCVWLTRKERLMKIQDGVGQMGDQHFYRESVHGPQVAAIGMLTHVIREKYVLAKL